MAPVTQLHVRGPSGSAQGDGRIEKGAARRVRGGAEAALDGVGNGNQRPAPERARDLEERQDALDGAAAPGKR